MMSHLPPGWWAKPLSERLWSRIDKSGPTMPHMDTPCWVWTGGKERGYGLISDRGTSKRVHRVVWEMSHGAIAHGLTVMYECDNRSCVRHLAIGTQLENIADTMRKGRQAKGVRIRAAKLTPQLVQSVREAYAIGESTRAIARRMKMSKAAIWKVCAGLTWKEQGRNG